MDPQINLDGTLFHKPCAKCQDCNCQITLSNFTKTEIEGATVLLCKIHYFKRFKEGGSYVGGDKFQVKNTRDVQAEEKRASMNLTKRDSSSTAPATSAVQPAEDTASSGVSVRDRLTSINKGATPEKVTPPPAVDEPVIAAVVEPAKVVEEVVVPLPVPPESVPKSDPVDIAHLTLAAAEAAAEPESSLETKSAAIEEPVVVAKEVSVFVEEPVAVFEEEVPQPAAEPEPVLAAEIEA